MSHYVCMSVGLLPVDFFGRLRATLFSTFSVPFICSTYDVLPCFACDRKMNNKINNGISDVTKQLKMTKVYDAKMLVTRLPNRVPSGEEKSRDK